MNQSGQGWGQGQAPGQQGYGAPQGWQGGAPPPPKKDKTLQWVVIGVLGIPAFLVFVALLGVVLRAVGLMDSQEVRAQKELAAKQEQARAAESAAAKEAAERAAAASAAERRQQAEDEAKRAEEDRFRQACKAGPSVSLQRADEAEIIAMCRMAVERVLKSPKSAEHPGVFDEDGKPASKDGCTTVYASYVDAQNSFGASIRTRYVCSYDPRTGLATINML